MMRSWRSCPERPRRGLLPPRLSRLCRTSWTRLQRKLPERLPETPLWRSSLQAQVLHLQFQSTCEAVCGDGMSESRT